MQPVNLLGLLPSELEALSRDLGAPAYRGRQLAPHAHEHDMRDPLPLGERAIREDELGDDLVHAEVALGAHRPRVAERASEAAADLGRQAERVAVLVGHEHRMNTPGVLEPEDELAAAVLGRRDALDVGQGEGRPLRQAAPELHRQVRHRVQVEHGLGYSPRRITVSTVGLVSGIEKLAREDLGVNLAISLHATTDAVRGRLMPINTSWNLEALLEAVRGFPLPTRRRIFFEYVMLDQINSSLEDARRLAKLLRGVRAKVNLIPFNDWEGTQFRRPPLSTILAFQSVLLDAGVTTTVRWSKGEDIGAACGQLNETGAAAGSGANL
ncbi:MAG: hypothetical protein DMD82_10560 [Candidatus Rokuibacteriota bacterium]|nr:MAG: hypothetical protein DMD82_10560 [Candidatus Rokubacteria bacterium]